MLNSIKMAMAAAAVCVVGTAASATTFDFTNLGEGDFTTKTGGTLFSDGLGVSASAWKNQRNDDAVAYLDGPSAGRPAGLGVCSSGLDTAGECNTPSDDNLIGDPLFETLILTFTQNVSLIDMVLRDADHFLLATNEIYIRALDEFGNFLTESFFTYGVDDLASLGSARTFWFETEWDNPNGVPYYISTISAVPLPAGGLLLISGLGLMGVARRRRKAT